MRHVLAPKLRLLAAVLLAGPAPAAVTVENFRTGDDVRHSVILLRGTVDAPELKVERTAAGSPPVTSPALVAEGKFKALVELKPGENDVVFRTGNGAAEATLRVTFRPMTDPHYVRLVWLTDSTGATDYATPEDGFPQTYEARLRTAALLLQCFTAERMHEVGHGRRTFRLETDANGQVVVHTIKAPQPAAHYYAIANDVDFWGEVRLFLDARHRDPMAKNMVLAAFTRKDPSTGNLQAHTALGGGNLGLFGSASVFSWPESVSAAQAAFADARKVDPARVHEDSGGRGTWWAVTSTTLGATLHEMGHTFGLPHCQDPRDIMTRGFDQLNRFFTFSEQPLGGQAEAFPPAAEAWFAPVSASFLRWSPWFQPDSPSPPTGAAPSVQRDAAHDGYEVTAESGIRVVGFWEGPDIRAFEPYPAPTQVVLTRDDIARKMDGRPLSKLTVIDTAGRTAELKVGR